GGKIRRVHLYGSLALTAFDGADLRLPALLGHGGVDRGGLDEFGRGGARRDVVKGAHGCGFHAGEAHIDAPVGFRWREPHGVDKGVDCLRYIRDKETGAPEEVERADGGHVSRNMERTARMVLRPQSGLCWSHAGR